MKVYCPNCGQANEAAPGSRVMCSACTALFDTPPEAPAPPPIGTPPVAPAPEQQWAEPVRSGVPISMGQVQSTNTLAIISLVSSLICCLPFISPLVGIITGAIAISQINANPATQKGKGLAIAGIVIGSLSLLMFVLSLVANAVEGMGSL